MTNNFVIYDVKHNLYWTNNIHYGYGFDNKDIVRAQFTNRIHQASVISDANFALKLLDQFKNKFFICCEYKIDPDYLELLSIQ